MRTSGVKYPSNKMFFTVSGNPVRSLDQYSGQAVCVNKLVTGVCPYVSVFVLCMPIYVSL